VASLFELDEVVFVPSGQPLAEANAKVSAGEDRYPDDGDRDRGQPLASRSAELTSTRGGPTYTRDTLRDLHALNPRL